VELEITPEPPEEEREAVENALRRLLEPSRPPESPWWRQGVLENARDGLEESALES
jgi:hypothetical protein